MRVALATCAELPELDADETLVIEPLRDLGVDAVPAVWDDPGVDWDAFDLVVVRSTWDYQYRRAAFLAWAARLPRVVNPVEIFAWNTDKRYLAELEAAGIPIVPTTFIAPGDVPAGVDGHVAAEEVVVKPSVSAGSKDTARYRAGDPRIAAHVSRLHAEGRTAMVQPYVRAVDADGETGVVYVGGAFSHAVRKGPILRAEGSLAHGLFAEEQIDGRDPTPLERALADRVMAFTTERFGTPVYARVDLLPGPVLIELELTEPSLFVGVAAGAPERLARGIAAAASG